MCHSVMNRLHAKTAASRIVFILAVLELRSAVEQREWRGLYLLRLIN